MDDQNEESPEQDIDDVFSMIALSEDQISSRAYEEGLAKGKEDGKIDGYHLGYHRGCEIGTEIGFYKGLVKVLIANFDSEAIKTQEKIRHLVLKFSDMLDSFPGENQKNENIFKDLGDIRACCRKITSLLKLNLSFPVSSTMSF